MLRHKNIDRVCCVILALMLLVTTLFVGAAASGAITEDTTMGYETRLFDQSRVHTIDIVMDDWEAFLETATSEEYATCHLVIDGESYKNVAIRGKGNTSLSSVQAFGNNRYSFKVEFDHYQSGATYHGLDKLSLNNLIQDNTYMKDYFAYTLMNKMGVASPLCSFVQVNVNGEPWGLYLAVEGVEDAFLQRNYGKDHGELYKPDSMSFGGGRGNGRDFDMDEMAEKFGFSFGDDSGDNGGETQNFTMPDMDSFPAMPGGEMPSGFDPSQMQGGFSSRPEESGTAPTATPAPDATVSPEIAADVGVPSDGTGSFPGFPANGMMSDMSTMPQMPGGEMPAMPTDGTMPQGFEDMQRGGMGGDMGMGSDDVKLQYIDDDPSSYTNIFNNAKTEVSEADQNRLIASLKALGEGDTSVVDTDEVIRYMAVHNFLCNDDSYTGMMVHNYYLYEEDGVLAMIPWDYNLAYGTMNGNNAASSVNANIDKLITSGSDSDRPMASWITASEEYTAQYHAVYQGFMTTVFDSGWFAEAIDRVTAMISPYVEADPTAFCTYEEFLTGAETLKQFCLKRAQSVSNQLNGNDTHVDASALTLSAMGTMGNMGGPGGDRGGFDRSKRDFSNSGSRSGNDSVPTEPTSGTESDMPVFEMPATAPDDLAVPVDSSDQQATEQPPTGSAERQSKEDDRVRPSFSGDFELVGMNRQSSTTDGLIWSIACVVLLCTALAFAGFCRNPR